MGIGDLRLHLKTVSVQCKLDSLTNSISCLLIISMRSLVFTTRQELRSQISFLILIPLPPHRVTIIAGRLVDAEND
ncbi:hypothetical protein [Nostoc sp. JL34]|uniref:hypothetical protein n=1 Tax=Nostoc sp. JL34 TaxID=2815397 RepID=UPI0025FD7F30|nr:hypothetical protein [Nostoc sp. JL34]